MFPYKDILAETHGIGFSIAYLQHPATNYWSDIILVFSSLDMQEKIYALIFDMFPGNDKKSYIVLGYEPSSGGGRPFLIISL